MTPTSCLDGFLSVHMEEKGFMCVSVGRDVIENLYAVKQMSFP